MAEFKLGRIRFVWQGTWADGNTYVVDDVVNNGGKSYICIVNHTASSTFAADYGLSPKWALVSDGTRWTGDWTAGQYYDVGDQVKFGGIVYICNEAHTAATYQTPTWYGLEGLGVTTPGVADDLGKWDEFATTFNWTGNWAVNTRYRKNDFVSYGGVTYVCNEGHISAALEADGLEDDIGKWDIFNKGIVYLGDWTDGVRYKENDIVKYGASTWICVAQHTSTTTFDEVNFEMFVQGLEFESTWDNGAIYQIGDTVTYGGYSYIAKRNNTGSNPSTGVDAALDWAVYTTGFNFRSDWATGTLYKVGDVVRLGSYTYLAIQDNTDEVPPNGTYWNRLNSGVRWTNPQESFTGLAGITMSGVGDGASFNVTRSNAKYTATVNAGGSLYANGDKIKILGSSLGGLTPVNDVILTVTAVASGAVVSVSVAGVAVTWKSGTVYVLGDIAFYGANSYICVESHTASSGNRPDNDSTATYWNLFAAGAESAVLTVEGDMFYYGQNAATRLPIGTDGQLLRVKGGYPTWAYYGVVNNVVYVAPHGTDSEDAGWGLTVDKPWKSVRYAANQVEKGYLNRNASALLRRNKQFIMKEVSNWVLYTYSTTVTASVASTDAFTCNDTSNLSVGMPIEFAANIGNAVAGTKYYVRDIVDGTHFTISTAAGGALFALADQTLTTTATLSFDHTYCERDTGLLLEAVIYDLSHGGTDESTKAAKAYYTTAGTSFINANFGSQTTQTVSAYNYLKSLVADVLANQAPLVNYQSANAVATPAIQIVTPALVAEEDTDTVTSNLISIVTDGITAGSLSAIPAGALSNTTISIKTGTYLEVLPIIVPKNTALVGDELRSTVVSPKAANPNLVNDKSKTVSALNRIKAITSDLLQNNTITATTGNTEPQVKITGVTGSVGNVLGISRVETNADLIYDIINNGADAALNEVMPTPTSGTANGYNSNYAGAINQIAQNYTLLKAEIAAYLNSYSVGGYSWAALTADQKAACQRDVGYLLDALRYDLMYGGNTQSLIVGSSYYSYINLVIGSDEKDATIAAYTRLKDIIDNIAQGLTSGWTKSAGNAETQVTSGAKDTVGTAAAFAQARVQDVIDWITNGEAPASVAPDTSWVDAGLVAGFNALQSRKAEIKLDGLGYVQKYHQELTYNEATCARDIGYMVDALGYDAMFGSNFASAIVGKSYYRALASTAVVLADQKPASLGLVTFLKYKIKSIASGGAASQVKSNIEDIIATIYGGAVPRFTWPSFSSVDAENFAAAKLLYQNKEFIKAETIAYISQQIGLGTAGFVGLVYDQETCARDVGYIVDALRYDLTYGGNYASRQAGEAYYSFAALQIDSNDKTATLSAYANLKTIVQDIANGGLSSYSAIQVAVPYISGTGGDASSATTVGTLIDAITTTIDTGTAPSLTAPSTSWVASGLTAQQTNLQSARANLITQVTTYIGTNYPNLVYDVATCERDVGIIIDALGYDLAFGSNYQTVKSAMSYYRAAASLVVGAQKSATLNSFRYLKGLVQDVVSANATALASVKSNMQTFINIIDKGIGLTPHTTGTVTYNNTLEIANGAEVLRANRDFLASEATAWIRANFGGTVTETNTTSDVITTAANHNLTVGDPVKFTSDVVNTIITAVATTNTRVTVRTTDGMYAGQKFTTAAGSAIGNIQPSTTYYVKTVVSGTQLVISSSFNGSDFDPGTASGSLLVAVGNTVGGLTLDTQFYVLSTPTPTTFTITATASGSTPVNVTTDTGSIKAVYSFVDAACRRDMTAYVDALIEDLQYTGNYRSYLAAQLYVNAVNGSEKSDMYHVRNSTGVRNMTLSGLNGDLTDENDYGTRRPTAGAYVSLDPGFGPQDSRSWVTNKSCYPQNVTMFGTGCVGAKIDGALHAGGNKSIVANDFTTILSDGIGVWCTGTDALTELVSVFSYYGYAGYLAELGGKIRATNGNSSYGTWGVIAEGVDSSEVPLYGTVDNRANQAQITNTVTDGTTQVLRFEFGNAGEGYTNTVHTINAAGYNAAAVADEFRDASVFESRIIDKDDANGYGGTNYVTASNAAQTGDTTSITIAATDTALSSAYVGMRIQITAGTGVGQYANILTYGNGSKIATVYKDTFATLTVTNTTVTNNLLTVASTATLTPGMPIYITSSANGIVANTLYYVRTANFSSTQFSVSETGAAGTAVTITATGSVSLPLLAAGWDHIVPGTTIKNALDLTTAYIIEPRINYTGPGYTATSRSLVGSTTWKEVTYAAGNYVAISDGSTNTTYSTDGLTWNAGGELPATSGTWTDVVYGGGQGATAYAIVGGLGGQGAVLRAVFGVPNTTGAATQDQIASVVIEDGGQGYTTPPVIEFTPTSGGSGARAVARVLNGKIVAVDVTIPGSGYNALPTVTAATDKVTKIVVTTWGKNYGSAPTITISGGGATTDATAVAVMTNEGVSAIHLIDADLLEEIEDAGYAGFSGAGYTSTPTVTITDTAARFVAISTGDNKAARSTVANLGSSWTASGTTLPASNFAALTFGKGLYVAVGGTSSAVSSTDGSSWVGRTIPALGAGSYVDLAYGAGVFVAISTGSNETAVSSNGTSWNAGGALPSSTTWTSIAYGNGRFVAIANGPSRTVAYSIDQGATWTAVSPGLPSSQEWSKVSYGQGLFFAIATGTTAAATSPDGINWTAVTMPGSSTNWKSIVHGNAASKPLWVAVSNTSGTTAASIRTGAKADGRVKVGGGVVTEVRMVEPGSGYPKGTVSATTVTTNLITVDDTTNLVDSQPIEFFGTSAGGLTVGTTYYVIGSTITSTQFKVSATAGSSTAVTLSSATVSGMTYRAGPIWTVTDPNNVKDVALRMRLGDGALGNPSFTNRGADNTTATSETFGDGRSDLYQPSTFINVKGLFEIPVAGANVEFASLPGVYFKLVTVTNILPELNGLYTALFQINPGLTVLEAPVHGDLITTRNKYSQVRLTGHDFLYIGTGNYTTTNYPGTPLIAAQQSRQELYSAGGRVFFTSTDQDGNFNVGNLFGVQQATGTATLNASAFNLSGLNSLQLGSVELGIGSAIITQFSTDPYFTANSDNIVPTQRAVRAYITSQIGGGQSSLNVNTLTSGVVYISGNSISTTTGVGINVTSKMNFTGGIDGAPVALGFFMQK